MSVLTELQNRGVEDVLIACLGGLKRFLEAIESVFSQTRAQFSKKWKEPLFVFILRQTMAL
ncbi:MAG: hypothetical protein H0Z29_10650 [Candidatus Marinimicrobia bacterium]|nr:hypothetical protein [Candidatus Neomarinimicrobiota bacterium]